MNAGPCQKVKETVILRKLPVVRAYLWSQPCAGCCHVRSWSKKLDMAWNDTSVSFFGALAVKIIKLQGYKVYPGACSKDWLHNESSSGLIWAESRQF